MSLKGFLHSAWAHALAGFIICLLLSFKTPTVGPFIAAGLLLPFGIWREWEQSDRSKPPWQFSGHRWLEAVAWPGGGALGAVVGVFV